MAKSFRLDPFRSDGIGIWASLSDFIREGPHTNSSAGLSLVTRKRLRGIGSNPYSSDGAFKVTKIQSHRKVDFY